MADYGIKVVNASSQIQIDSTYQNYSLVKQDFAYHNENENWPWLVATFPTQSEPPIVTYRPSYDKGTAVIGVNATQAFFVAEKNVLQHVEYQVWRRGIVTPATWGININNASGNTVFSSSDQHFKITKAVTATMFKLGQFWTQPFIALASGPRDFVIVDKGGAEERIGDGEPPPAVQEFYYRAGLWNKNDVKFSIWPRQVSMATVFQSEQTTTTMAATFLVIGVSNNRKGRYRVWRNYGGGQPDSNSNISNYMDAVTGTTALWGSSPSGKVRYGGWPVRDFSSATSGVGYITSVSHCNDTNNMLVTHMDQPFLGDAGFTHVLQSTDRGRNFTKVDLTGVRYEHYLTSLEGLSATLAIAGTRRYSQVLGGLATPGIFRSTDAGANWNRTATFDDVYWISRESSAVLYAGNFYGPPYKSSDYGQTWNQTSTAAVGYVELCPLNGSIMVGIKTGAKIARSTDGGQTWKDVANFNDSGNVTRVQTSVNQAYFADASNVLTFSVPDGHIFRSDTLGSTWDYQPVEALSWTSRPVGVIVDHIRWPNTAGIRKNWVSANNGWIYSPYET